MQLELVNGVLMLTDGGVSYEFDITVDDITKRLSQLGYTATQEDTEAITFEIIKSTNYTLNYCNIVKIPSVINPRLIDRVCGEFLYYKKNSGTLEGFDYDAVIKQIKEGDTSITYAVGQGEDTPENRFDNFIKSLKSDFDKWITPHRRLRW